MLRASLLILLCFPLFLAAQTAEADGYARTIAPFLKAHCAKCHEGEKPKGDFVTDAKGLPNDFADVAIRGKWKEVVNVLNSHEMPPKKEKQPNAKDTAAVVDWITAQTVKAELNNRESGVALRRLNREEYRNTIRDLLGIDFDVSGFPQDPPAGGFDNNGSALTLSPLHVETYLNAARQILDRALVGGEQPKPIKWRFEPQTTAMDSRRVKLDPKNNSVIVNGGNNTMQGNWVVVHHDSWDMGVNARNFAVPVAGEYIVRIKAAGKVPTRAEVVASAQKLLDDRRVQQNKENPKGQKWHDEAVERDLEHFKTAKDYDYGPPRIKLVQQLGPQPRTVAEFDADGTPDKPKIHEISVRFNTESAGIAIENAYSIPGSLENYWMQRNKGFARPELLVEWFELEGPIYPAWPPASHTGILFDSPLRKTDEAAYAREVLRKFMTKAYRRPASDSEVSAKYEQYLAAHKQGQAFLPAINRALAAVLVSSNFLFLVEEKRNGTLSDHELASRLSYFLWSSCPDAELAKLADEGRLKEKEVRIKQLTRMLADPKARAFTKNFAGQWLGLRDVGANPPSTDLYPQYDRHFELSIVAESEEFFRHVLENKLSVNTMVKADFVVVNERMARFYGIPNVRGDEFRKVPVVASVHRGGIPTQASILTTTSNGTRTSPVKRGTWILKTLLGIDPGLPIANAGEIAPKVPGIDKATVRKRLEIHRTLDQCARCHNKIDPLGFALENYNACGEWREQEGFGYKGRIEKNDPKIDASSEMIDGTKIVGIAGLQDAILKNEDLFHKCLSTKLFTYALGREIGLADALLVKDSVAYMKAHGGHLHSLLEFVVTSEAFGRK